MFVQATEEGNSENVQILGLALDNYFPDTAGLKHGWEGSLHSEDKLVHFVQQHITGPLASAAAASAAHGSGVAHSRSLSLEALGWPVAHAGSAYSGALVAAGVVAAAAAVAVGAVLLSRPSRR